MEKKNQKLESFFQRHNRAEDSKKEVIKRVEPQDGHIEELNRAILRNLKEVQEPKGKGVILMNNSESETIRVSTFAKGINLQGDITIEGHVIVEGIIHGNVDASGNLELKEGAKVEGTVDAQNLIIDAGSVYGDIHVRDSVELSIKAKVIGNIDCRNLNVSGQVDGDLNVSECASLTANSQVLGNIETLCLSVEQGAQLVGCVNVREEGSTGIKSIEPLRTTDYSDMFLNSKAHPDE